MNPPVEVMTSPSLDLSETVEIARVLEAAGVGRLWLADAAPTHRRDVYIALTLCAQATGRIGFGPGVTNPITRDSSVTACSLATLIALFDDRFALGMGRGDAAVVTDGGQRASFTELGEYLASLDRWHDQLDVNVPIVLAASGPVSLRKAREFGRGVFISLGADVSLLSAGHHAYLSGSIDRSAPSSGGVIFVVGLAVSRESDEASYLARPLAAKKAKDLIKHPTLYPDELESIRDQCHILSDAYDYAYHFDPRAPHADLVSAEVLRAFCVSGSPDECVRQLEPILEFAASVDDASVAFQVGRANRLETLELLCSNVLPELGYQNHDSQQ